MTVRISLLALALSCVPASGLAAPPPEGAAPASAASSESARLFEDGVRRYADGDPAAALALFRRAERLEPGHRAALAAIRRLEIEASRISTKPVPTAPRVGALERFLLGTLPRWYYFERIVGDGLRDVGAQSALNARIAQLMGERRFASARGRLFSNDGRLRELVRRAPLAAGGGHEV